MNMNMNMNMIEPQSVNSREGGGIGLSNSVIGVCEDDWYFIIIHALEDCDIAASLLLSKSNFDDKVGTDYDAQFPRRGIFGPRGDLIIRVTLMFLLEIMKMGLANLDITSAVREELENSIDSGELDWYKIPSNISELKCVRVGSFALRQAFTSRKWTEGNTIIIPYHDKAPNLQWLNSGLVLKTNMTRTWCRIWISKLGYICLILFIFAHRDGNCLLHPKILDDFEVSQEIEFGWGLEAKSRLDGSSFQEKQNYNKSKNKKFGSRGKVKCGHEVSLELGVLEASF